MYPLESTAAYPNDQWYIAGYASEFTSKPFARKILGQPLVFYRTAHGDPVALWGLCVHRFMPLERGHVDDDALVCPYHGYTYGPDGACIKIPTGGKPSIHAQLRNYPVVERASLVWIWMGDPKAASLEALPDASDIGLGEDNEGWRIDTATILPLRSRAALLMDNLFDLSHVAFIHADSIPGGAGLAMIEPVVEGTDMRLRVSRHIPGVVFDPEMRLGQMIPVACGKGPLYANLHSEMYSPALVNASGPWLWELTEDSLPGKPVAMLNFIHGITPETDKTTHYFGIVTRNYALDDESLSDLLRSQIDCVRREDVDSLEAVESVADHHASSRREISTKVDEGALKVRRVLRKLVEAEA
jgi:phenylpropionate dioxygenase-like ring-hydroxylating dioxygenase large terminal subunit